MKNAICLSLFIAFIALVAPPSGHCQNREPVMIDLQGSYSSGFNTVLGTSEYHTDNYDVPLGKRLVIEQVFFEVLQKTTTAKIQGKLRIVSYNSVVLVPLQLKYGTDHLGRVVYTTNEFTKLYVKNPSNGGPMRVDFLANAGTSAGSSVALESAILSGYLEDAP